MKITNDSLPNVIVKFGQSLCHPLVIMIFSVLVLARCTPGSLSVKVKIVEIPYRKISFPIKEYFRVFWLPERGLAVAPDVNRLLPTDEQIVFAFEGETDPSPLPLEPDPDCYVRTEYYPYRVLPDGRLGILEDCIKELKRPGEDTSKLLAYDWETHQLEQIVANSLPSKLSLEFTWNPDMTRGVQDISDSMNGTLYWIGPEGSRAMEITLSDGRRSWPLAGGEYPHLIGDAKVSGIAFGPDWSPDGSTIAFFASFDAIGRVSYSRMSWDVSYDLIFLDPDDLSNTSVLKNIYKPSAPRWSPDGYWLAFNGSAGLFRQRGLWLYSPAEGTLTLIARGEFGIVAWSPDSASLGVIACVDETCDEHEVRKYDLKNLVSN